LLGSSFDGSEFHGIWPRRKPGSTCRRDIRPEDAYEFHRHEHVSNRRDASDRKNRSRHGSRVHGVHLGDVDGLPESIPPSTNLWYLNAKRDPATDTLADAAIWESRSFFYKDSMAASKYAFDASRAQSVTDFRKSATDLRLTCDGCHTSYQHKD
jgi:hypothetical protein